MKIVSFQVRPYVLLLFVLALPFGFSSRSAQGQAAGGSITGTITDATGAVIPGAQVQVRNIETGAVRNINSDSGGYYSAPSLSSGRYQVTVIEDGFNTEAETGINLVVGQDAVVNLTLTVGKVAQKVSVTDAPLAINTTTQQISGLLSARQIKELPLNGRSYDELITLNPATVNYTAERTGGVGTSNSAPGNMFAVGGHRPQDNIYLLNGIEYTGASEIDVTPGGASGELLGVDAVREFNVVSDTYGAEYGKRTGAQIIIDTESGSNQIHGSVFEFLRNSALDARNYFDQGNIPNFQRNQFGGSLGGPLLKNKLLLFGNYEGFRQNLGLSDVTYVPDNATRAAAVPSVQPLLNLWPVQNGPELGGGIAVAYSHPLQNIREDFGTARIDYNISTTDTASSVYTVDDSIANTPTANPFSSDFETLREQVLSVQEQHIFSASILNTFRAGFSRGAYYFTGETPVKILGWVGGEPIGAVVVGGGTALNGASQITGAGTNAGSNLSAIRNLYTLTDHVYITHDKNQIEAGVWTQNIQSNSNLAQDQYGQASFSSIAHFISGTVDTFTVVPAPTALDWRSLEYAGFLQDTVHVLPNLELRAGFRFESTNGWNESQGRASNYIFGSNGVLETQPRVANSTFTNNRAKFLSEPRVGIAWQPGENGKTVVHAGFGVYYALLDSLDYRLDQNAPFNTTQVLKNVPIASLNFTPGVQPTGGKVSPSGIQPDVYTPGELSYSLNVERELAPNTSIIVGYLGSHGYHQILSEDVNEPIPSACPYAICPGGVYYAPNSPLANPNLGPSTTWVSQGVSNYNALTIDIHRHFTNGLQLRGVYTYSKNMDDGTAWNSSVGANAPGFVMFPGQPKLDYGRSNTDIRHIAEVNGTYDLPFGHNQKFLSTLNPKEEKVIGGWSLSAIATLQSGFPFTPQLGYNPSNNGDTRNPVRPSLNPAFTGKVIEGGHTQYFNPLAFTVPYPGTYGNIGRNTLDGPGLSELDLSFRKTTELTRKLNLQFRAEFFNILNHTNFGSPNAVVYTAGSTGSFPAPTENTTLPTPPAPSPTAGAISSTATTSRQIQFGAKLLF